MRRRSAGSGGSVAQTRRGVILGLSRRFSRWDPLRLLVMLRQIVAANSWLILRSVKFVLGVEPDNKKNITQKESMNPAMLVTRQLKLPSLATSKLPLQSKTIWFGCFFPKVLVATECFFVCCPHLHGR